MIFQVADLKRELKVRGLNNQGNKGELVDRLMQAMQTSKTDDGSADSVDDLIDEDEVLNVCAVNFFKTILFSLLICLG